MIENLSSNEPESPGLKPLSVAIKDTPKKKVSENQRVAGIKNLEKAREVRTQKASTRKAIAESTMNELDNLLGSISLSSETMTKRDKDLIESVAPNVTKKEYSTMQNDFSILNAKLETLNENLTKTYDKVFKLYEHKKNKQKIPQQQPIIIQSKQDDFTDQLRNKILNIRK